MQVKNLAAVGLLLAWGSLTLSTSTNVNANKKPYNVCETSVCINRAQLINDSLNTSVDPCTDFYTYACGGWMAKHKIPDTKSTTGTDDVIIEELKATLRDILGNITLVEDNQNVTDKAALLYNACVAVPNLDDRRDVVLAIMNIHGLAEWPKTHKQSCGPGSVQNATTVLAQMRISTVLSAGIARDSQNLSAYTLQVDQPSFSVGRNQLINQTANSSKPIIHAYRKLIQVAMKFMKPNLCDDELEKLSDDMLSFEGKLANMTAPPEERRDFIKLYKRTTIDELERNFSNIPLRNLLQKEFSLANITLSYNETVESIGLDYYSKLNEFLGCADPDMLFNYAGLRRMLGWASVGSKEFRNASFELHKVTYGTRKQRPRWKVCVDVVNDEMPDSVGYLYVQHKFSEEAKKEVQDLANRIMAAFNESLKNLDWMDNDTRKKAQRKLRKMGRKIAYPDWLFNTTYLEELYKYVPNLSFNTSYGEMMYALSLNHWILEMKKLRRPYDTDAEWVEGAAVVNAFYNPNGNEMVFPSGILQGVFYEHGLPRSLNFGGIGAVVGHEMTHGFDDQGSQYDEGGALKQWWSNKTRTEFMNRTKCFEEEFGNITDKETNMTLNGKNTVGENIADSGGLRLAFEAFKHLLDLEYRNVDTRLKGMENVTGKQLFFISNAMTWCSLSRPEYLKVLIQYDPHSPAPYRVNVPMSNMEGFSEAFGCSVNSTMNRKHRCSLW